MDTGETRQAPGDDTEQAAADAPAGNPEGEAPANAVLVLFAHPAIQKSRVNSALVAAIRHLPGVTFHDLYEAYPDMHIDVRAEQRLLEQHQLIIWQHPFYWYSSPAIVKEWQDLVLEYGFAYGRGGRALAGKMVLTAISTGGPPESYAATGYNHFTIREFLRPFEQTARLCHMEYLPPFVVQGTLRPEQWARMDYWAVQYREAVVALRDSRVDWAQLRAQDYASSSLDWITAEPTERMPPLEPLPAATS